MSPMLRALAATLVLLSGACGQTPTQVSTTTAEPAEAYTPPRIDDWGLPHATSVDYARPMLGVAQAESNFGGQNEWVLRLDQPRQQIYFGQYVETEQLGQGHVTEFTMPFQSPVVGADGNASLNVGRLSVTFTRGAECESNHGGLGFGLVTAQVRIDGGNPISMCMVQDWPADARRPDWSTQAW